MSRMLAASLLLSVAAACKPPQNTFDAGCYPAPISEPVDGGWGDAGWGDGGWQVAAGSGCTPWTGDCNTEELLEDKVTQLFSDAGTCTADTDCALYQPSIQYLCYARSYTPPINAGERGWLDGQLAAIICGYCQKCFPTGGISTGAQISETADAGCTETICNQGQCAVQTASP